jgi:hypothetical protein
VLSRYSLAKGPELRVLPMASISSMKIILGAFFYAASNKLRTRAAPKPEYFYINSLPDTEKNGTPDSPAQALANKVFPVPGGPVRSAPFGTLAPILIYFYGFFKKSTNYVIYDFASCIPATSLNNI